MSANQPWDPTPPPPPPPPTSTSGRRWLPWAIGGGAALVALLAGVGIGSASSTTAEPTPATTTVTIDGPATTVTAPPEQITMPPTTIHVTKTVKPPPPPGPKTTFGDGVWLVGKDIAAGTYVTSSAHSCYWERERDLTGGINSIIANDLPSGSHAVVTILSSDKAFDSERCGTWHRISG